MKYIILTLFVVSLLNVSFAVQAQEKLSSIAVIVKEKQYQKQHHDYIDHKDAMHKVLINLRFMVDTEKFSKLEKTASKVADSLTQLGAQIISTSYEQDYERKDLIDKSSLTCNLMFYIEEQDYSKLFAGNIYEFENIKKYSITIKNSSIPMAKKKKRKVKNLKNMGMDAQSNYTNSSQEKSEKIEKLLNKAQNKAQNYASILNVSLGQIIAIEEVHHYHGKQALKVTYAVLNN